jgi:cytoskeletal protein RodZ
MFDKIAEELKEARIKNNLTLKQLSAKTRIDLKFLEAMEEGNFSFLPELYVKAFLKEYSTFTGLNPEIILRKYDAAKEGQSYEDIPEEQFKNDLQEQTEEQNSEQKTPEESEVKTGNSVTDQKEKFREVKHSAHQSNAVYSQPPTFDSTAPKRSELLPKNKNSIIISAAVGSVIIFLGLIYLIFFNKSNEIVVAEKPYDEVVTESRQRYEENTGTKADSSQSEAVSADSLNLLIQTTDTSWVKLILDDSKEEEFILFPNSQKSIKAANNFKITFGRSSAIKLQLNNQQLAFNPGSRNVSHVLINSKGLEFLKSPPQAGQEQ